MSTKAELSAVSSSRLDDTTAHLIADCSSAIPGSWIAKSTSRQIGPVTSMKKRDGTLRRQSSGIVGPTNSSTQPISIVLAPSVLEAETLVSVLKYFVVSTVELLIPVTVSLITLSSASVPVSVIVMPAMLA